MPAAAASPADDGNWVMPGKDYASTRFSALSEITPANVSKLGLAFTFSTATSHGYEAPPLVVGSTMYLITPFPNYLYALDLSKRRCAQVGIQARAARRIAGRRLLRHGQPRRRL